jgi:hypothetical protein
VKKEKAKFPAQDGYRHYYLRDAKRQPIACVAFKGLGSGVIRGIAICSRLDQWDRVDARAKAVGRCKKAEAHKFNDDVVTAVHPSAAAFLQLFGPEFTVMYTVPGNNTIVQQVCKSCFDVAATAREARIIAKDAEYASKQQPPASA